jgi:hypothetical protein
VVARQHWLQLLRCINLLLLDACELDAKGVKLGMLRGKHVCLQADHAMCRLVTAGKQRYMQTSPKWRKVRNKRMTEAATRRHYISGEQTSKHGMHG